jgi:flagellar biosynthesis/type III secretory pathway M-ring protein FliF/YscJ
MIVRILFALAVVLVLAALAFYFLVILPRIQNEEKVLRMRAEEDRRLKALEEQARQELEQDCGAEDPLIHGDAASKNP